MSTTILRLDAGGLPQDWISVEDAASLIVRGSVGWTSGEPCAVLHGGTSMATGTQSLLEIPPVIAADNVGLALNKAPAYCRSTLFRRDESTCLYCGERFRVSELTMDHILPRSRGGPLTFDNAATACFLCNHIKASRTPEEANMPLLHDPFIPTRAEYLYLMNAQRLPAQEEYLRQQFRNKGRSWLES